MHTHLAGIGPPARPGVPRGPGTARALSTLLAVALLPATLGAQQVRGRFLDEMDSQPLAGAYVLLLREGVQVASTVTRVDGGFRLVAPEAGTYTLRADQLGYGVVEREVLIPPPGEALVVELTSTQRAIELEGLTAEVDRRCDVPAPVASQVAMLWEEVGAAFQVAALMEERELYDLRLDRWRRSLEPGSLRILEEERREDRGVQRGSPFASLPPDDLAAGGYVRETEEGGFDYFAPDARVLLSTSFQDTHCFGVTIDPPADGDEDWVGVRFVPRAVEHPDIRGVLWIDARTLQPQRLDYRYTELPGRVGSPDLGGRVIFQRLPDGPWIIREWWIRMPRVQVTRYRTFSSSEPRYRYEVVGIEEVGGQVTRAGPRGGELVVLGSPGRVEGTVTDAHGAPGAGASVALEGTIYRARADQAGRFVLEDVPPGRYLLTHTSSLLDSLELDGGGTPVSVEPGEPTRVAVRLPSPAALLAAACVEPLKPDEAGVARGVVRGADGAPAPGAQVELSWFERIDVQEVASRVAVSQTRASATLPVDAQGRWLACGLPVDAPISVRAVRPDGRGASGPAQELRLRQGDFPLLRLTVPEPVAVEVDVDPEATPEERRVLRELADLGIRREALGRRFAGPREVERARGGSMGAVDMVQVLGLPGVRVRRLENEELCVYSNRNVSLDPFSDPNGIPEPICAALVLDGLPSDIRQMESVPGEIVAAVAYLRPSEAGARFGGGTDGGVLVVWTLRDGR